MFLPKKKKFEKYSDLSEKEIVKIMKKSIRDANRDQSLLVEEYDKRFGKAKA